MKLKHKLFCIDFDGTIAYDAWPGVGELIPGAKETMLKIKELGGEIAIWTCRTDEHAQNAKDFLDKNGIPYDYFNKPFAEHVNIYGGDNSRKIFSDVYIDDRCILWEGGPVNWEKVQNLIFIDDENWNEGDLLEAVMDCGFPKGSQVRITENDGCDFVIDGIARMPIDGCKIWFKKVE